VTGPGLNLAEVAAAAAARLDPAHRDFFAGGAGDERTLRANETAFDRWPLRPRVLRDVTRRDLSGTLLGADLALPVLVAPTGFHRLAHPDGELATARAVHAAGTVMMVSSGATTAIEDIAAAAPATLWFQLYAHPDRAFTEAVIRRAEAAGCRALVVTVDSPVFGHRPRDLRSGFLDLPAGMVCENMRDATGVVRDIPMNPELTWATLEWLRGVTELPIVLKGILHPADARLAAEHGADAIVVSNHGGRQLDGVVATVDALPDIVAAVAGRLPVLLDGGIRRGTDVLTALALGAAAVAIGRPVLWGLATGGADGVRHVLELLRADLDRAMALTGAATLADITGDLIAPEPRR
jgi:4-hydroxymandelate oxidase